MKISKQMLFAAMFVAMFGIIVTMLGIWLEIQFPTFDNHTPIATWSEYLRLAIAGEVSASGTIQLAGITMMLASSVISLMSAMTFRFSVPPYGRLIEE